MRLLNDFFKIQETKKTETGFETTIQLTKTHVIYNGHFPGHPVTPAVVQMQILHELIEEFTGKKMKLASASECKFLKIFNPEENLQLTIQAECKWTDDLLNVNAKGIFMQDVYFKIRANYLIKK